MGRHSSENLPNWDKTPHFDRRVPLDSGAYDKGGGSYWGFPDTVRVKMSKDGQHWQFYRVGDGSRFNIDPPVDNYFALYDNHCGRYLATGYNSTSKEQLAKDWCEYVSIDNDPEDDAMFAAMTPQQILDVAFERGFELEASETPFEEQDC
jgi:hypothetical protein